MKLTELQRHKLLVAYDNASDVLRQIKGQRLSAKELVRMKQLEEAVQILEMLRL